MKTSYFSKYRGDKSISICSIPPIWYIGKECKKLSPPYKIESAYKKGLISRDEYIELYYKEKLHKLNPREIYEELFSFYGDEGVLVCWHGEDKLCHRHIVADWLNRSLGTQIMEL